MQIKRNFIQRNPLIILGLILLVAAIVPAQSNLRNQNNTKQVELGRGMSIMTADLMQIAAQSDLFLQFTEKIGLTENQLKKLQELYLTFQKYSVTRQADLDVADAELQRLVTNDSVDLNAVRAKVKEIEAIQTDLTMKKIETVLDSIKTLTHDQHLKVMLFVREMLKQNVPPNS